MSVSAVEDTMIARSEGRGEKTLVIRNTIGGRLQLLRPHIRRILPQRLHHCAGHVGRYLVRKFEKHASSTRICSPTQLPAPVERSDVSASPIVLVNASLTAGGAERQIVIVLKGLMGRGQPAILVTLDLDEGKERGFFLNELRDSGIEVRNAEPIANATAYLREACGDIAFDAFDRSLGWAPRDVRIDMLRLAAEFHRLKPRVVHGWQDATGIIAAFAALAVGTRRIVVAGRNLHPEHFSHARPFMRGAYRYLAQRHEVALTNNSAAGARSYADWLGIDPAAITVIRNGVATSRLERPSAQDLAEFRHSLHLPADTPIVGGAFRLQTEKRPLLWLDVAARIARRLPEAHFVVFGDGTMRAKMQQAASRSGLGKKLVMPGNVADMRRALAILDVILLTSSQEGTPNVVLEATSLGVPVVATDAGGTPETIRDGVTGFVVNEGTLAPRELADALADAVVRTVNGGIDPEDARREGSRFIETTFGLERMLDEMVASYGFPREEKGPSE